jgi:hypothetical protein
MGNSNAFCVPSGCGTLPLRHHDQWRGRPDRNHCGRLRPDDKKLIVGPSVPVERLEIPDRSELKSGAAVAAAAATKQPDGTFTAARIDFGRGGVVP